MIPQKIISLCVITTLSIAGLMMFPQENNDDRPSTSTDSSVLQNASGTYSNQVEFNQDSLQLQNEVVQFEIKFNTDDAVDVSTYMYVSYVDETITSVYYILTDGNKPLLDPRGLWFVPERKYSIITPKIRLSIGKFRFIKILNDGNSKIKIGSSYDISRHFDVKAGDSWYLTIAVPTTAEKSGYSITLTTLYNSMEVKQLKRHNNIGLYSANYNQFSGKYYACKLLILGGFSLCAVSKEITTKDGSIIEMYVGGHRKGNMMVYTPEDKEIFFNKERAMRYSYWGNESGTWRFSVKGWSIYFRVEVVLLYIDIDPHVQHIE
jgi:hypothetical protein